MCVCDLCRTLARPVGTGTSWPPAPGPMQHPRQRPRGSLLSAVACSSPFMRPEPLKKSSSAAKESPWALLLRYRLSLPLPFPPPKSVLVDCGCVLEVPFVSFSSTPICACELCMFGEVIKLCQSLVRNFARMGGTSYQEGMSMLA